jgi:hypothetical protein
METYTPLWLACIGQLQRMMAEPVAMESAAGQQSFQPLDILLHELTLHAVQPQPAWEEVVHEYKVRVFAVMHAVIRAYVSPPESGLNSKVRETLGQIAGPCWAMLGPVKGF